MPQMKNSYDTLSGPEKAAAFLFALGEEQAGKLFKLMDDDEIRILSQKMARPRTGRFRGDRAPVR